MSTALATIETVNAVDLFNPSIIDPILAKIRAEVLTQAEPLDISTEENRKALAALAYKVGRSKTFIDNQRVGLVSAEKKRLKLIDQEGARIWDNLEALQKEAREQKEREDRIAREATERAERQAAEREAEDAERAERDKVAAVEAERQRQADAKAAEEAATKAREKDKAHKAEWNNLAMIALVEKAGLTTEAAKKAVTAIVKGEIPNVRMVY